MYSYTAKIHFFNIINTLFCFFILMALFSTLFPRTLFHHITAVLANIQEIEKQIRGDQHGIEDIKPDDNVVAVQ